MSLFYFICNGYDVVTLSLSFPSQHSYDLINVSLASKPEWFLEMYPIGKVPLLLLPNEQKLPESDEIIRHIDKLYGSETLLSHCGIEEFEKAKELITGVSVE